MAIDKSRLLELYEEFPFQKHPLWQSVLDGALTYEQVIRAECQHWIRTRAGRQLRQDAVRSAKIKSKEIFQALLATYVEECTDDKTGPSHLALAERLIVQGGVRRTDLSALKPTPGNSAAMALYREIAQRGVGCHLLGAGTVEHYYCQLSPKVFDAYVRHYGMSEEQAETYRIHGPLDKEHADRAFSVLGDAVELHGEDAILQSVRDAFIATSLHYDGMLQAATGLNTYWDGRS